ncbi:hypothetical protein PC116_g625 [Phytophthora cactorum]|uniref:Uncharacterized protein n=1 Tax=Phytophthora cactorum TaxID=29920 RepID=A0A8T1BMV3_9STRA|nr:hypothetical protein PC112_g14840 [Phytophthora cactorum]KAG2849333.1 hypothetical protein PC111_g11 [Phytophthora cactorum]KAG2869437.1 hypothetical protein PC113_g242 [Phytophthora cactorum]KAG2906855.1 hypothetical protein PC115_g14140 [Phytophthora cactorum]KAG2923025.1 hypothetical protein PC117_g15842 [Phytophthora cactorum]
MEATVPVKRDAVMQKAPALLSPAARRIGDIGAGRLIPAGMGYEHLGYAESIYRHSFEEKRRRLESLRSDGVKAARRRPPTLADLHKATRAVALRIATL